MSERFKRIEVSFYQSSSGRQPVREWLRELQITERKQVGVDIARVEYGWPVGMPTCRSLNDGLWEVRIHLSSDRIARVLFCFCDDKIVLLHGFIKKSQKTPESDLSLARKRKKEVEK